MNGFLSRRRAQGAMVLLELLVALSVFAFVAFGLVLALDTGMTTAQERDQIDAAVRGLQNQMALLHADRVNPVDHDLPVGPDGFQYHLNVVPVQMLDQKKQPLSGLYQVTIQVKWKDGAHVEDRSVSELVYQP